MPYCLPSPPSSPTNVSASLVDDIILPSPSTGRHHRRSASLLSLTEFQKNSAFAPTPALPRRASQRTGTPSPVTSNASPRRALFSLSHEEDEDEDEGEQSSSSVDSVEEEQEVTKLSRGLSLSRLDIDANSKSAKSQQDSTIPFPSVNDNTDRTSPSPPPTPLPRTSSTPIILSNGKPLKPSLKSASAPHLPDELKPLHLRSQSAPSTPSSSYPKNVHFKDEREGLETVRLYNKAGKPANLNYGSGAEETETETEYDSSYGPSLTSVHDVHSTTQTRYSIAAAPRSTEIPNISVANEHTNVILETLTIPDARPPVLRGSVLVRNITFAKSVAVRFTLDDWQTTSEVNGSYVTSLPSLPPPFKSAAPHASSLPTDQHVSWDWASVVSHAAWDRFSFVIKLEDLERKLLSSTLFLAMRYQAHGEGGGEWWDNNAGDNYKLSFQASEATVPAKPKFKMTTNSMMPNAMFSAASSSPSFPPSNSTKNSAGGGNGNPFHRPVFPFAARPSPPIRSHSNPTIPTFATLGTISKPKSRLSLSNYVAPSYFPEMSDDGEESRVTTPAGSATTPLRSSQGIASFEQAERDMGLELGSPPTSIIGGMPATAPTVQTPWSPSSPVVSPTATVKPINIAAQLEANAANSNNSNGLPTPSESPDISPSQSALFDATSQTTGRASPPTSSNDTYAEFVKKWCFHQSPPPVGSISSPVPRSANNVQGPSRSLWLERYDTPSILRHQSPALTGFERA